MFQLETWKELLNRILFGFVASFGFFVIADLIVNVDREDGAVEGQLERSNAKMLWFIPRSTLVIVAVIEVFDPLFLRRRR